MDTLKLEKLLKKRNSMLDEFSWLVFEVEECENEEHVDQLQSVEGNLNKTEKKLKKEILRLAEEIKRINGRFR